MKKKVEVVEEKEITKVGVLCDVGEIDDKATNFLEKLNNLTLKKNKEFSSMTKYEKRVELAKDVLASLKTHKYIAHPGTYVQLAEDTGDGFSSVVDSSDVSGKGLVRKMKSKNVTCTVCAIGSLFISNVRKSKATSMGIDSDRSMVKSMKGIFSESNLRLLEFMFEGHYIRSGITFDSSVERSGLNFYERYRYDADLRLRLIMENIIENKGRFIYGSIKI